MDFKRARSDEQRDQRRQVILTTAATMLTEAPVAQLSLNELGRRAGLAKSNVLRYFVSREAILLELLSSEFSEWIGALNFGAITAETAAEVRGATIGHEIASSLSARPVLCDLISAQAAVLERNVTTEVVLRHKRSISASADSLSTRLEPLLPELDNGDIYQVVASAILMASAIWPHSQPTEALVAAYASEPEIAAHQVGFADFLERTILLSIAGLIALKHPKDRDRP